MKNIRSGSLADDRPIASRDCALCTKRRIRCDRTAPSCLKCASRNLVCPGFDLVRLRWGQGVASRGRLAGSQLPVQTSAPKASLQRPRTQQFRGRDAQADHMQAVTSTSLMDDRQNSRKQVSGALISANQDLDLVNQSSRVMLLGKLLNHFTIEVVPRLTWIKLPGNLWLNALPNFAQNSKCLYLSLCCLASAHLSATRGSAISERSPFDQLHKQLQERSLRSVNDQIAKIMGIVPGGFSVQRLRAWLIETLASMVALCYSEVFMVIPTRWNMHLRGCQTVVDHFNLHRTQECEQSVETFLIKEVADLEALNDFSAHGPISSSIITTDAFLTRSNTFWGFTGLIREITFAERTRQHPPQDRHTSAVDMSIWHYRANDCFRGIMSNISDIFSSHEDMSCFKDIVRTHCYATVIYSYQALAPAAMSGAATTSEALIAVLQGICTTDSRTMKAFWHNLYFPLLIAGTLCSADEGLQRTIEQFFLTALSISGAWCNNTSLQFLREYWRRPTADASMTWIQYARSRGTQTGSFIVF
ncbi:hypothetical protein OPT61_g8630 [Boeremia exigua]|uniref:Uncharacterized protein n=1 Tax=Boeremia exigua TaxID=749465 RepID=A0ACC2HZ39_9PLEO|nr:hypothetical protein OPT61_g8630 [Boeremia exigua]